MPLSLLTGPWIPPGGADLSRKPQEETSQNIPIRLTKAFWTRPEGLALNEKFYTPCFIKQKCKSYLLNLISSHGVGSSGSVPMSCVTFHAGKGGNKKVILVTYRFIYSHSQSMLLFKPQVTMTPHMCSDRDNFYHHWLDCFTSVLHHLPDLHSQGPHATSCAGSLLLTSVWRYTYWSSSVPTIDQKNRVYQYVSEQLLPSSVIASDGTSYAAVIIINTPTLVTNSSAVQTWTMCLFRLVLSIL